MEIIVRNILTALMDQKLLLKIPIEPRRQKGSSIPTKKMKHNSHYYFRIAGLSTIFAIIAGTLTGCLPLHQFSVEQIQDGGPTLSRFEGLQPEMQEAAAKNGTLRLLIVQGMGITPPGYSTNLVDRIADKLDLRRIGVDNDIPIPEGPVTSNLRVRQFANGANRLCTYELTWSPVTEAIKTNQFGPVDWAPHQVYIRQIVNNSLKTGLMDRNLSDVVLYVGKFRPLIQLPITNAIYRMVADSSPNDPISILTHSLAGYMVIDTLSTMYESGSGRDVAANYAAHVKQLFMMANQMPILNLSDQTNFDSNCGVIAGKLGPLMKNQNPAVNEKHQIQIVAFSDPNDLLSYKLRKCDIQEDRAPVLDPPAGGGGRMPLAQPPRVFPPGVDVVGFNVTYTVYPWSILGIFSWPPSAHSDWWTDSAVPGFLAFGHRTTD